MHKSKSKVRLTTKFLVLFFSVGLLLLATTALVSLWVSRTSIKELEINLIDGLGLANGLVAASLDAAVAYDDQDHITARLKQLEGQPILVAAVIFDMSGNVIRQLSKAPHYKTYLLLNMQDNDNYIVTERVILNRGKAVGRVKLMADLSPFVTSLKSRMFWVFSCLVLGFIIISSFLIYLLTGVNKRFESLIKVTKTVHDNHQLNLRVAVEGNDEVSTYSNYFNAMLDVIEVQTRKLETFNLQLSHQILHDKLCDIPNREYLRIVIRSLIKKYQTDKKGFSVMEVDVDHFKRINDQYGHQVGDLTIQQLSQVIRDVDCENKFAARLGGDEFVIVIEGDEQGDIALDYYKRLAKRLETIIEESNNTVLHLSISAGIALYPKDGSNIIQLLNKADTALYQAKRMGRDRVCRYQSDFALTKPFETDKHYDSVAIVDFDFIQPIYQPIYHLDKRLLGVECLATYQPDGDGQIIRADSFVEALEEQGMIDQMDLEVLKKSLENIANLNLKPSKSNDLKIFHNFSVDTLSKEDSVEQIENLLEQSSIKASSLVIEVTESLQLNQRSILNLNRLGQKGFLLCIDDFGAGFTNPDYFRDVKWNYIKIDKKYVGDLSANGHTLQLIDSLFALANLLGIDVIAEGVESGVSIEILKKQGCQYFQGYHFGKPWSYKQLQQYCESEMLTKSTAPTI